MKIYTTGICQFKFSKCVPLKEVLLREIKLYQLKDTKYNVKKQLGNKKSSIRLDRFYNVEQFQSRIETFSFLND